LVHGTFTLPIIRLGLQSLQEVGLAAFVQGRDPGQKIPGDGRRVLGKSGRGTANEIESYSQDDFVDGFHGDLILFFLVFKNLNKEY
jgi:hypothetical protein